MSGTARTIAGLASAALLVVSAAGCGPATTTAPPSAAPAAVVDDLRYRCSVFDFDPEIARAPGFAESGFDDLAIALRAALGPGGQPADAGTPLPPAGWHEIGRDEDAAEFLNFADGRATYIAFGRGASGEWKLAGWGDCQPELLLPRGLNVALWEVVGDPPGPAATSVTLLVTERECASGQLPGDRLIGPRVLPLEDRVLIVFAVRELGGNQECPGNPSTKVTVQLGEPLGDRELVDPSLLFGPN